jgi:hypothetical protein
LRTPRLTNAVALAFSGAAEGVLELQRLASAEEPAFDVLWWQAAALLEQRDYPASRALIEGLLAADAEEERAAALFAVWRARVVSEANAGLSRVAWGLVGAVGIAVLFVALRWGRGGGARVSRGAAAGAAMLPAAAAAAAASTPRPAPASAAAAASTAAASATATVDALAVAARRAWDVVQALIGGK